MVLPFFSAGFLSDASKRILAPIRPRLLVRNIAPGGLGVSPPELARQKAALRLLNEVRRDESTSLRSGHLKPPRQLPRPCHE